MYHCCLKTTGTVQLNDFKILSTLEEGLQIMYMILQAVVLLM